MNKPTDHREQVLATMSTWVASIADHINNPIAGISTAVAMLEREMAEYRASGSFHQDLVDDSLSRIRYRLHTLGDYVAELTEVSRPAQMMPLSVRVADAFNLTGMLRREGAGISIECLIETNAQVVTADPTRLKATLKALVLNSLEAADGIGKPAPRLRLTARREPQEIPPGVILMVEDNGPGFNAHELSRVTEPFFTTKEASSGLGLATAKRFTEAHGGRLNLGTSIDLGGAAVSLFLPDRQKRPSHHAKVSRA